MRRRLARRQPGNWARFVLPITGVIAAAMGAWMLERLAGGSGWWSLWLVGAVGPVAFYGTDVWEHAPAAGAAVLGTAMVLAGASPVSGLAAGLCWGLAISLRTETAIVAATLVVATLFVSEVRSSLLRGWKRLMLGGAAGGAMLLIDRLTAQQVIGTDVAVARAGSQVSGAVQGLDERWRDALVTTFGLFGTDQDLGRILLGVVFVGCLVLLGAVVVGRSVPRAVLAPVGALLVVLLLARLRDVGFVPGTLAAAPVAAVGLWVLSPRIRVPPVLRVVAIAAVAALPIVWALQWRGNLAQQWGGRYQLVSGALLTVCGAVLLSRSRNRAAVVGTLVIAVLLGLSAMRLHIDRTQYYGNLTDELLALPCDEGDVLISASPFLLREAGGLPEVLETSPRGYRYLTAQSGDLEDAALDVAEQAGVQSVLVLDAGRARTSTTCSGTRTSSRDARSVSARATFTLFRLRPER